MPFRTSNVFANFVKNLYNKNVHAPNTGFKKSLEPLTASLLNQEKGVSNWLKSYPIRVLCSSVRYQCGIFGTVFI